MFRIASPQRIANKIILLVMLLVLFSILLWGSLTYSGSRDELLKTKSSQLNEIAFRLSSEIGNFFLPLKIELNLISETITLEDNKINDRTAILLHRLLNSRSEIEELSLVGWDGMELIHISRMSGIASKQLRDLSDDILVKKAIADKLTMDSIKFSEYLEPTIRLTTAFKTGNRNQSILSVINLKWLWDIVQSKKAGQNGIVYVIDESLKLVAHPDPSLVLSNLKLSDTTIPKSFFINKNEKELSIYTNLSGKKVAGVSRFDPLHQWWIIVEQPVNEALAPLDRVITRFFLAFLLATVITIISVFIFSKRMMRPLEDLEIAISNLSQGNLDVSVQIPKSSELSSLSSAFNLMALKLKDKTHQLEHNAHYDELTKLPNRKLLYKKLEERFSQSPSKNQIFALLLLDLDRFKEINDSLGHNYGDILLKQLGTRLSSLKQTKDFVARLGGDEFALILETADTQEKAISFAKKARSEIQRQFKLDGIGLLVDGSIGISMYPNDGDNVSELMRHADVAMYQAKKDNLGVAVYNAEDDINSPERLALINDLPKAIEDNQLLLHYQPKINLRDRKVIGLEALVRWNHPEHGLIPPDQFIPIVELGDSIISLTDWVINQALKDCKIWHGQGFLCTIAVNISALNIQDQGFLDKLSQLITKHEIDAKYLHLELTESVIMADTVKSQSTIEGIHDQGLSISIDDYGTGYSSLAYLKNLSVNELKIDRSFVMNMDSDDNDAVIIKSTIDMSHNLGLQVTAEGVETKDVLELLDMLDCEFAQGYYISRPLPCEQILPWLETWKTKNIGHIPI